MSEFCLAMADWLTGKHDAADSGEGLWFNRLVQLPITRFRNLLDSPSDGYMIERTWDLIAPLADVNLPLVFEHGDLSYPNILVRNDGGVGVIDWEAADSCGLPATDLFLFLAYIATTNAGRSWVPAFHDAFFGPRAWARLHVAAYCEVVQLPAPALRLLFLLCWSSYLSTLAEHLTEPDTDWPKLQGQCAAWFRSNPF